MRMHVQGQFPLSTCKFFVTKPLFRETKLFVKSLPAPDQLVVNGGVSPPGKILYLGMEDAF